MLKLFSNCKQTNAGTSDGLEQVNGLNSAADSRWSNIHLNNKTRDLTIRNIRRDQSGVYKVEINTISIILHRKFKVTLGGMKNVSVMTGKSVILLSSVLKIQEYDLILWTFEDHLMAKINKMTNQFLLYDSAEGKFKGRLELSRETGDLTISDSRTTDSGDYHLHMSNRTFTLQRTITVTVTGLHPGYIALICVCVVLVTLLVALVTYYRCKDKEII
ncbi:uncharacterized protein LOC113077922 isoform X3 [Carassius auratus]|uniref:Uncharacterized protein LOC113077922 isoform X3 n=1 Tax=Carassius auratus TaxID=7957 RepID=A0A6P6NCG3_CARAU|nr:uncharacterized protein LOC113077922 isoform X3 [Carassius auratus]